MVTIFMHQLRQRGGHWASAINALIVVSGLLLLAGVLALVV
jgi:hypothetical protein